MMKKNKTEIAHKLAEGIVGLINEHEATPKDVFMALTLIFVQVIDTSPPNKDLRAANAFLETIKSGATRLLLLRGWK